MSDSRSLQLLDTLKVHQIRVEPKRLKATYTVIAPDGTEKSTELIYSYDSVYFNPKEAADINLGSMMAVQVALNYGLFFKTIEFDGLFDDTDRRFLSDMMENTSREIFVVKFLHPNEFIKAPYNQLQPRSKNRYTAANLCFSNTLYPEKKLEKAPAITLSDHYAILSSGGKDSLLTYGIINEIGTAHPVYINEAGRHWYTAVNAHKYYRQIEPNTVKPWCNSDRLFNWMVRQLPFIKENFQQIRADIYPVRLWTVAVFLFGVLPIARKRGIGNILIGNEYDTTVRGNYKGITHYNGLYDQSKYFDNALTRYYKKKGWNIYQYSVLRSLSELLILKVLVKRYPDLQRTQVSCHAAHDQEGRMLPCGKCEKCRRIVGMLRALDEDPGRCGYTQSQIDTCLQALAGKSVKQLGTDAAHLYHLLLQKGILPQTGHSQKMAGEHPEIEKLRFDNERSLLSDLPVYIRKPLFNILLPYTKGAVRLSDRKWHTFELQENIEQPPYFLNIDDEKSK